MVVYCDSERCCWNIDGRCRKGNLNIEMITEDSRECMDYDEVGDDE